MHRLLVKFERKRDRVLSLAFSLREGDIFYWWANCDIESRMGCYMRRIILIVLFLILALFGQNYSHSQTPAPTDSDLKIVNVRVGQGDATLVLGPVRANGARVSVLIDAGDGNQRDAGHILSSVLRKYGVKTLNYVIMTHDDADHISGAIFGGSDGKSFVLGHDDSPGCKGVDDDNDGVIDFHSEDNFELDIDELNYCGDINVETWVDYGDAVLRDKDHVKKYQSIRNAVGNRIVLGKDNIDTFSIDLGKTAKVIPYASNGYVRNRAARVSKVNNPNERSIAVLVSYGTFDFLVAGDLSGNGSSSDDDAKMEQAVGEALVRDQVKLDILHVNHHGSNDGSAADFLDLVNPNIAIVSAGNKNSYRHPSKSTLNRLYENGVYRTIFTSFGTTSGRIDKKVRNRVAIYQSDIIILANEKAYDIRTSRPFLNDVRCVENSQCSKGIK